MTELASLLAFGPVVSAINTAIAYALWRKLRQWRDAPGVSAVSVYAYIYRTVFMFARYLNCSAYLFIVTCSLAGCGQSSTVNMLVTVVIDDEGVARDASGVWQLKLSKPFMGLSSPYRSTFTAEAIEIIIPHRGSLFIVPSAEREDMGPSISVARWPELLFNRVKHSSDSRVADLAAIAHKTGLTTSFTCHPANADDNLFTLTRMPTIMTCPMVLFTSDVNDPKAFRSVDVNDIGRFVGKRVNLRPISIEITDQKPTAHIYSRLPWLREFERMYRKEWKPTPLHSSNPPFELRYMGVPSND